jgi:hypothetical protein
MKKKACCSCGKVQPDIYHCTTTTDNDRHHRDPSKQKSLTGFLFYAGQKPAAQDPTAQTIKNQGHIFGQSRIPNRTAYNEQRGQLRRIEPNRDSAKAGFAESNNERTGRKGGYEHPRFVRLVELDKFRQA